jgi:carbon-monoxide dehydrogenase medium subunit
MIPGQFDYVRPGSLDEALRILKDREGEAKVLSGGYSLCRW